MGFADALSLKNRSEIMRKSMDKTVKMKNGSKVLEAPEDYVMVVGKDKPITVVNKIKGE